ncbi:DUF2975 domain-containing protein [Aureibaculum algae]|uniref:DUF2975 domain-containing protein n=2 Tax=Flavobacteriaceae TaxID=49546 RepID=A0A5B7TNU8_9FLAO|nr:MULTISPECIES: DUF2975 domain-containing protein [Flavobacteriaceae]QCX37920.1 DUF2975 domain-containing protein [Aureibaculum algae]GAL82753.1 hypothetical protein JCM19274_3833 [Algibacter lectus]
MKTILKFLNVFILILIISLIIDAFGEMYSIIHYLVDKRTTFEVRGIDFPTEWSNLNRTIFIISSSILTIFLVYLAFIFRKVITSFSRNNYFSSENVKQLTKVGKGLIVYGFGLFLISTTINLYLIEFTSYNFGSVIGKSIAKSVPVFIFSSFILLIASIIKKGNILQEENELTI